MSATALTLIERQIPLERVLEFLLPVSCRAERVAGHGLAAGVELQKLFGHVAHGLLDAGLRLLPGRAAEPVERGPGGAGVLLTRSSRSTGTNSLSSPGVAELHELLRSSPTSMRLRPTNTPIP
jgi:hypothetical protein